MIIKKIYDDINLQNCYENGVKSKIEGANTKNSNFFNFLSTESTKAWENGRKDFKKYL